jgi:hypothetical protein
MTGQAGEGVRSVGEVTISHRGARYQIGRGPQWYGIWGTGTTDSAPIEQWPETDTGWAAAWSRFCELEAPGTIAPVQESAGADRRMATVAAVTALGIGVACGIASLFPGYLGGSSLASDPAELAPHLIYLAAWATSTLLILPGGTRRRIGALLGVGVSVVTFGLFLADVGTVIAAGTGAGLAGAGLALGVVGWLGCAAGSALALWLPAPGAPAGRARQFRQWAPAITAMVAGLGAAIAFAPSWDRYVLRTATGVTQTLTAGNAFANPGPVIAGDVAVMIAVVVAVVAASLWRPVRHGAALLAGALIPLVAQAISAIVQIGEATPATQLGISRAQAAQLGLTVSAGLTLAFWVYCAFLVGLALCCALLASAPAAPAMPGARAPLPAEAQSTTAGAT